MRASETPYSDKYIWKLFAIAALLLILHFTVYEITISENSSAKSLAGEVLTAISPIIAGSGNYRPSNLPYEVPYLQLTLSLVVTLPLALILLKSTAKEDLQRALNHMKERKNLTIEHAVFDIQLFTAIGILMMLLMLLIPPSSTYIGPAKSSFFGIIAPIKYASCSFVIANLTLIFFMSFRVRWR
ncbi:hypothetical protein J2W49_003753 [Hydrogenophaga palleronii]|uniref:DUF2975 domain-containing protein n=1 Tax=Hydrogenophaga palleronii TaxID=65655 RepID=A0ABU1WRW6_9BURK|nr:hypothetical protein [Hydrogenophaga palleronii]MDR7151777.1 hypothetical protein [Hydrogenophaga palleronii]